MEETSQKLNIANQSIAEGQSRLTRNPKTSRVNYKAPSLKAQKAFKEYTENGGNATKALLKAGYSENTVSRDVTESNAWKMLLERHLSDIKLTVKHKQLLASKNENISIKALDLGYKVKGKYQPEENKTTINVQVNNLYQKALVEKNIA